MATKAQLVADLAALTKKAGALYLKLRKEILASNGQKLAAAISQDDLHYVGHKAPNQWRRLGLPIPGKLMTTAQANQINSDASELESLDHQMAVIYAKLHPNSGLSDLEIFGLMVLAVAGAAAIPYAAAGSAAAGTGASAGTTTAASTGTLATATGITAPALTGATLAPVGTSAITAAGTAAGASAASELAAAAAAGVPAAAGAAAAAGTTASSIAGKVAGSTSAASGADLVKSIGSDITKGLNSIVPGLGTTLSDVVGTVGSALKLVDNVTTNYIEPILTVIEKDYNTITGLISTVQTLAHQGIQGILAIPQDITDALSTVEAGAIRVAQVTGGINEGIVSNTLIPGITEGVGNQIGNLHTVFKGVFEQQVPGVGELSIDKLNDTEFNLDQMRAALAALPNGKKIAWPWGDLLSVIALVAFDFAKLAGTADTVVEWSKQLGQQTNPITPLAPGEAVRAWWRGQISADQAAQEMARQGIDPTRAKLLHDMEQWLPGINEAIRLYYRQSIGKDELFSALGKQGLSDADVNAMLLAALEPLNPREAIEMNGRLAAGQAGFLPNTLNSKVPLEYKSLYSPRFSDPEIGNIDWLRHWKLPDFGTWATMYFRGAITKEQLAQAATAGNIPTEIVDGLTLAEQELIQLWMIPDMLGTGILTEQEAMDYLTKMGIEDQSAKIILKYGFSKAKPAKAVDTLGLVKISLGNAATMYEDGIVNREEYLSILEAHGYDLAAAQLTADLADMKLELAQRKAQATGWIEEVLKGLLTPEQFKLNMVNANYTSAEQALFTTEMESKLIRQQKILSQAEIKDFMKYQIFTASQAQAFLQIAGYSAGIAQGFILMWEAEGITGAGQTIITP